MVEELGRAMAPGPALPTVLAAAVVARSHERRRRRSDCCPGSPAARPWAPWRADRAVVCTARRPRAASRSTGSVRPVIGAHLADVLVAPCRVGDDGAWVVVDLADSGSRDASSRASTRRGASPRSTVDGVRVDAGRVPRRPRPGRGARLDGGARGGRARRGRAVVRRHGRRVRQGARAVRAADRAVPGGEAPVRRHARPRSSSRALRRGTPRARLDDGSCRVAFAAATAVALALDAAFENAKDCIQVLGGHRVHVGARRPPLPQARDRAAQPPGPSTRWRVRVARARARRRPPRPERRPRCREADAHRERGARVPRRGRGARRRRAARARIADAGLPRADWPAPWGRDATAVEQLVIDEEFRAAQVRATRDQIGAWALPPLIAHGTQEQQERWIPPTLRGEITWCQLFSEPGAGSDLAALTTRADARSRAAGSSPARRCGPRWRSTPTGGSASPAPIPTRRSTTASRASWST